METNKNKFSVSELFLVMADWNRTYTGIISREKTKHGTLCRGNVIIDEGKVVSMAQTEKVLTQNLDHICRLKLDHGLHEKAGESTIIMGNESFLN